MNSLIPFFVAVPLAGAFLTMILGRFTTHISKYLATVVLLFLAFISFWSLFTTGETVSVYKVGGWEAVNSVPIGIYLVLDGFSALLVRQVVSASCQWSILISYMARYTSGNYFYALLPYDSRHEWSGTQR
jgi:multicomponent Na+:H+ antiporter subunit D